MVTWFSLLTGVTTLVTSDQIGIPRSGVCCNRNPVEGAGQANTTRVGGSKEQAQQGRARGLHGGNSPETTGKRVIAAGERPASVMLPDSARNLISASTASAAAARGFVPIDRILGGHRESNEAEQNQ